MKHYFVILIFALNVGLLNAQSVTFNISKKTTFPDSTVAVSISVSAFTDVYGAQFTLQWNPDIIAYVSTGDYNLPGLTAGNFGANGVTNGMLTFAWDDPVGTGITVDDETTIFTIAFKAVGDIDENTSISFTDNPTPKEVVVNLSSVGFIADNGNIAITNLPKVLDASIVALILPQNACGLSNSEDITLVIKSVGDTIISNVDVSYMINESNVVTETITNTINPNDSLQFTFTEKIDLSIPADYMVKAWSNLQNDNNPTNDTLEAIISVFGLPEVSFTGLDEHYYINALSDTLTGNPQGGTFTGPGMDGNIFDPVTAGMGTHTIIYQYTDTNSCSNSTIQDVTVNALPVLIVMPAEINVSNIGDTARFEVINTGGGTLNWTATKTAGWFFIDDPDTGSNDGIIRVIYEANAGSERNDTIAVTDDDGYNSPVKVVLHQSGSPCLSSLSLHDITVEIGQTELYKTSDSITVAGNGTYFIVEGNGTEGGNVEMGSNKIVLNPGFDARKGCVFLAHIDPCSMSEEIGKIITEIPIIHKDTDIKLFPNPTSGELNILLQKQNDAMAIIEVMNLMGNSIYRVQTKANSATIDLSQQPPGIYVVKVMQGSKMVVNKVIKQ